MAQRQTKLRFVIAQLQTTNPMLAFTHTLVAELPFILNVPAGDYEVRVPAGIKTVRIRHKLYAASDSYFDQGGSFAIGTKAELLQQFPDAIERSLMGLRTVVDQRFQQQIDNAALAIPSEPQLTEAMARDLILRKLTTKAGAGLLTEAAARLNALVPVERSEFAQATQRRMTARNLFPSTLADEFVDILNTLVRHYMAVVGDMFVEEMTLQQLAGTVVGGILTFTTCDGLVIDTVTTVGRIPPIMRRPWFDHGPAKIQMLRQHLTDGNPPDAVDLLGVRARMFFERGAYRSAIIEASAAMEYAIARRIVAALVAGGQSEADAIEYLRVNQRFSDRGKGLFKATLGLSLAERNNALWSRVVAHRDNIRHKIVHSNQEPSAAAAKSVVDDFIALADLARNAI